MEYWDIYDEDKRKTGRTMARNDWRMADDEFHLTVLGVITRPDGKFFISRRKLTKPWAAGWWEVPGGGVIAGEESRDAVIREIKEETGLDVSKAKGGYAFSYRRDNHEERNNYFVDIYKFLMDFDESDIHVKGDEVEEFRIATKAEIEKLASDGIFLHYDSIKAAFD